jgi:hypothetical protein
LTWREQAREVQVDIETALQVQGISQARTRYATAMIFDCKKKKKEKKRNIKDQVEMEI